MAGLWDNLDRAFSTEITPLVLHRKFSLKSWRWMCVYRQKLNPEVVAFATTKYHGHRHVPKTVDELVDELAAAGQQADSKKLMKLIVKQERGSGLCVMINDPTKMDPSIFVGKQISKDFEGLGIFEGVCIPTTHLLKCQ